MRCCRGPETGDRGVALSDSRLPRRLERDGIDVIVGDLLAPGFLESLPDTENVIFMADGKFGTSRQESLTWAMNTYLPGRVAERFCRSRIVAFSTGNVYPLSHGVHGGSTEGDAVDPCGRGCSICPGAGTDV